MNVHRAVLDSRDKQTGTTTHYVDGSDDTGPIITQTDISIEPGDTPGSLAERVLDLEHEFFVEKLAELVSGLEDQPQ